MFTMKFYSFLAFLALFSTQQTKASKDQLMMCRPVENSQDCSAHNIIPTQGRPGKRGAKGEQGIPGETGEKGNQGTVDYATINSNIQQRINQVIGAYAAKFDAKLDEMERTFQTSMKNIRSTIDKRSEYCRLKYEHKCFWVKVNPERGIRLAAARTICSGIGAELANVYSESHYNQLMRYIREKMPGVYAELYLGMKINTGTMVTSLSDGSRAPFLKWHPGYPSSTKGVYLQVAVTQNPQSTGQGFFNYHENNSLYGVVCEMDEA